MAFRHERTYLNMKEAGREEEFHQLYESAVEKIRYEFGKKHPFFIDGKEVTGRPMFQDISPVDTRIVLGLFQKATPADARRAVEAAKKAFKTWSATPWQKRVEIFRRAADLLSERKFQLAALMTFENGKNRYEAMADVDEGIDLVRWYCEEMEANNGYEKEMLKYTPDEQTKDILKPYGVWAVIPPFNFPFAIAIGMASGAMITGNTIVMKPASDTPWMALKLYETMRDAGLPAGVFNYVTGPGETTGKALVQHPDVKGIAFTGSKDVGLSSWKEFTKKQVKPMIAEMGGKNPVIVTAKADLNKAVEGVMKSAFGYGGQKCSACSRVLVERAVKKEFLQKLVEVTKKITIGDPSKRDTYLGPVINKAAYEKYRKVVQAAKRSGKLLMGGNVKVEGDLKYGYYVEPAILDGVSPKSKFAQEEFFVPFLTVLEFRNINEAMSIANDVEYGLTAGIFSNDQSEIDKFLSEIEAGVVYVNRRVGGSTGAVVGAQPFGGWKNSGITGKHAGGHYYLQQFLKEQSQTVHG